MRFMRRRAFAALAALVVAGAIALTGCGAGGAPEEAEQDGRGGTLTVGLTRAPASFDTGTLSRAGLTNNYLYPAYQPLIEIDADGELAPSLATSWEWLDDTNTTFRLELRDDAKFSDGSPVNAESVVGYWEYALQTAYSQYWLGGATFETPSDHEVVVHLQADKPRPSLPWAFTTAFSGLAWITSPEGIKDPEKLKLETAGAGPYVLDTKATVTNSTYVYTPNPHFYDQDAIKWDKIVLKVMPQEQTRLAALQTGQVDVAAGSLRQLKAAEDAGLQIIQGPGAARPIVLGDLKGEIVPALEDVRVRQALMHAIDWKKLGKGIFGDSVVYNQQLFIEGSEGYLPDLVNAYPYDVEKAKELLAEAGYPDGFDAGEMLVGPVDANKEIAQVIQAEWAKVGVTMQPLALDPSMWGTRLEGEVWPVNLFSSILAPVGPTVTAILDPQVPWLANTDLTELYELVDVAQHTPADTEENIAAWEDVNRYIVENVLLMTGLMPNSIWFAAEDIEGVVVNPPSLTSIMLWQRK